MTQMNIYIVQGFAPFPRSASATLAPLRHSDQNSPRRGATKTPPPKAWPLDSIIRLRWP